MGILSILFGSEKCPKCGGKIEEFENYKMLLDKTFIILRCVDCKYVKNVKK